MIKNKILNFFSKQEAVAPIRNKLMMIWSDEILFYNQRVVREKLRVEENRAHVVYYFHSLSDPYSHLTINILEKLTSNFNIEVKIFFVSEPPQSVTPERGMYKKHCLKDAEEIAGWHGLKFKATSYFPKENEVLAYKILNYFSRINQTKYINLIKKVSSFLWSNDLKGLQAIISNLNHEEREFLNKEDNEITYLGDKKISEFNYYFSASFHYEGENYWGIDRISHLESRLIDLGLNKKDSVDSTVVRLKKPKINPSEFKEKKDLMILEFFPSLNSPYTYISFKRIDELITLYPVKLIVRPVLPMLMRNIKIPSQKGKYILSDAAREGRKYGSIIKKIYSPIGSPARKAYSLFPIIDSYGLGFKYLKELTRASFYDGINIGDEGYLEKLISGFGLSWDIVKKELKNNDWKNILDQNLADMYEGNSWGVPSFKVTNLDNSNPYYQWGQDRIWLIENEIINRLINHR